MMGMLAAFFVRNAGFMADEVAFGSFPSNVAVLKDGSVLAAGKRLSFGSKPREIVPLRRAEATFNYYGEVVAEDQPTYSQVMLKEVWPNIDVVLTHLQNGLEIQFFVRPGANPEDITITADEGLTLKDFKAYQGSREVPLKVVREGRSIKFKLAEYDRSRTLVIDPTVSWTLIGSSSGGFDNVDAIYRDANTGHIYAVGATTDAVGFGGTLYGSGGQRDAFALKLSPTLDILAVSVFASSNHDYLVDITSDGTYLYAVGTTFDNTFGQGWSGVQTYYHNAGGNSDILIMKLNTNLQPQVVTLIGSYNAGLNIYGDESAQSVEFIKMWGNYIAVIGSTSMGGSFNNLPICGQAGLWDVVVFYIDNTLNPASIGGFVVASPQNDMVFDSKYFLDGSQDAGQIAVVGATAGGSSFTNGGACGVPANFGTMGSLDAYALVWDPMGTVGPVILLGGNTNSSIELARSAPQVYYDNNIGVWSLVFGGFTTAENGFLGGGVPVIGMSAPGNSDNDAFVSEILFGTPPSTGIMGFNAFVLAGDGTNEDVMGAHYDPTTRVLYVYGITDANTFLGQPPDQAFGTLGGIDLFYTKIDITTLSVSRYYRIGSSASANDQADVDGFIFLPGGNGDAYLAGWTADGANFAGVSPVATNGVAGAEDGFVMFFTNFATGESERVAEKKDAIKVHGDGIEVRLSSPGYVGFDVYDASGRLVKSESVGYLPAGRYSFSLKLPKGVYTVRVRAGEEVVKDKLLF